MRGGDEGRVQALGRLLSHAARHSPFYREQGWAGRLRSGQPVRLSDIPVTRKALVRDDTAHFYTDVVPPSEGRVSDKWTTGSTSEPILIKKTARHFRMNTLENSRLKAGWGVERQTGYVQRSEPDSTHGEGSVVSLAPNGNGNRWKIYTTDPRKVIALLERSQSSHLSAYPSATLSILERNAPLPFLRLISTVGEVISEELVAKIRLYPQCAHFDLYGSTETGVIAAKCHKCERHHFAVNHLIVEVLNDADEPVSDGELGRVVVTPLYNLAMPLLRYEIGDYVRVSTALDCPVSSCGITQIAGREKNLFILPDGTRIVPAVSVKDVLHHRFKKYKLVQVSRTDVRLLYIREGSDVSLTDEEAQGIVSQNVSPLFRATAVRVEEIRPGRGGKYLQHECLITS